MFKKQLQTYLLSSFLSAFELTADSGGWGEVGGWCRCVSLTALIVQHRIHNKRNQLQLNKKCFTAAKYTFYVTVLTYRTLIMGVILDDQNGI